MQKEEVQSSSSKVHTFYPLFNVHSADFFSNNRERSERTSKIGGEIPSKRKILYDIIMRRDLEKVDVALLQSSFE